MNISTISRNLIVFLTFIVLVLPACEKLELGKEFYLKIGEDQKITSQLSFKIDSIWDSRCPTDWRCLTGGDVSLFFNIRHSQHQVDTVLTLNGNQNKPFSFDGYIWKILEVNSLRANWEHIDPQDVTIKMVITKD